MSNSATIWIVDDDQTIRLVLERALGRCGFQTRLFETSGAVIAEIKNQVPQAIITDIRLPDADGLSILPILKELDCDVPVIAMTAFSDLDQAVAAFQQGVFDYLSKPFDLDQVISVVERAVADVKIPVQPAAQPTENQLLGDSPAMQEIFRTIGRLSHSDISVLLTGETGSGKELVARALHHHSPRSSGPFVAINTAAVPSELLESELFGHERGSFTGAHARRVGRFEEAANGTLFLDEIGDMPLPLQTRLLRVLAEREFHRVGGRDLLKADVRVIAATHQNLEEKIDSGAFREDLYHRINVIHIALPPLRQRSEDVGLLAEHFMQRVAAELGLEEKRLRPETLGLLSAYKWPGNVRQLLNICRQLCVMAPGEQIFPQDLPIEFQRGQRIENGKEWSERLRVWAQQELQAGGNNLMGRATFELEGVLMEAALAATRGQRQKAAKALGVGRNTLTRKIRQHADPEDESKSGVTGD
ncbi:MAG TPA: nitrogen regulation protein NR(I) [Xanthomonadales bacterium]|nr:nitrogen regulation protein NR(I) [Xanthomonadales bacterium]